MLSLPQTCDKYGNEKNVEDEFYLYALRPAFANL